MVMLATLNVMARPGGAGGAVLALWPQGTSMSRDYTAPLREISVGTVNSRHRGALTYVHYHV